MSREIFGYLSNQWGFSETGKILIKQVKERIEEIGVTVLDPFEECAKELDFNEIAKLTSFDRVRFYWEDFSRKVTPINNALMARAHCQLAILDGGPAIDDGVASEIGYYAALTRGLKRPAGKIFALRTDFRGGENIGCVVNPQIEGYIYQTGVSISRSLNDWYGNIKS